MLTKKEFAEKIGVNEKDLPIYYKRGKFVYVAESTGKGARIDPSNAINADFIKERQSKMAGKPIESALPPPAPREQPLVSSPPPQERRQLPPIVPRAVQQAPPPPTPTAAQPKKPVNEDQNKTNVAIFELKRKREEKNLEKAGEEVKKVRYQNMRTEGEVIPTEAVTVMLKEALPWLLFALRDAMDFELHIIAQELELTPHKVAEIKKRLVVKLNKAYDDGITACQKKVKDIVKEHSVTKDVGQRE